uniref:Uncharacterized protein n=1 Tax=Oryza punctata TaxID=4537 RepID=A0A0E0JQ51_ORYPU
MSRASARRAGAAAASQFSRLTSPNLLGRLARRRPHSPPAPPTDQPFLTKFCGKRSHLRWFMRMKRALHSETYHPKLQYIL